ncbi:Uncharacterized protein GBIM_03618 [Gryllus bimaculatus]|nr:Uncharacterized protein GBIM_03618 [Gryllus bimaculatus]
MKALKQREADVAVCDMTITVRRLVDADFTDTICDQRFGAYMGLPARRSLKWTDFLTPFSAALWTAAVGAAGCLALFLAFVVRVEGQRRVTPRDAWLFVSAAFCQQGQPAPRAWSGRVLCVCAHLVALVLAAAHSGALISALFSGKKDLPFRSVLEALNDSTIRFLVPLHTAYLNSSLGRVSNSIALYEKLHIRALDGDLSQFVLDVLRRVCEDQRTVALLGGDLLPVLLHRMDACDIEELPSAQTANPISIAMTKGNPFVQLFSYYTRRMRRTGVLARVLRTHWPQMPQRQDEASQPAVRLGNVAPVFPAFAAGVLLALLILAFERRLGARTQRNGQRHPYFSDIS